MSNKQMSFIVRGYFFYNKEGKYVWEDNTEDLDKYLEGGWKVVSTCPMGAFGYAGTHTYGGDSAFASLVILEKE